MMQPDNAARSDAAAPRRMEMRRLEAAFHTERPRLLRYLNRLVGRDAAPDLVQEVFARAAATRWLAEVGSLPAYLTGIARNLAFERSRTWKRAGVTMIAFEEWHDPGMAAEQTWRIEAIDLLRLYRKALRAMPPTTRRVFALRRHHLVYREISERLGMSIASVHRHARRASTACRSIITTE